MQLTSTTILLKFEITANTGDTELSLRATLHTARLRVLLKSWTDASQQTFRADQGSMVSCLALKTSFKIVCQVSCLLFFGRSKSLNLDNTIGTGQGTGGTVLSYLHVTCNQCSAETSRQEIGEDALTNYHTSTQKFSQTPVPVAIVYRCNINHLFEIYACNSSIRASGVCRCAPA